MSAMSGVMIAIDPGVWRSGWAFFVGEYLKAAGFDDNSEIESIIQSEPAGLLVIERPQVDTRTRRVDLRDVLDLSLQVGRFLGVAHAQKFDERLYFPREWKGQMKKSVTRARAERTLTTAEKNRIPNLEKAEAHNVWDAVALGLFSLDRKTPARR